MRKIQLASAAIVLFLVFYACKKSVNPTSNARTVQNLSGSYNLTALKGSILGISINLYDSLPPCERDNVIQLNADLTAQFIDSGTVSAIRCVPPSDSTGTWSLSQNTDTLYIAGSANFITSWNGTTLVLTGDQSVSGYTATVTTTLVKK
ncbi:MAG TPA: lipocalin family protein [Puia sp.]